MKENEDNKNDTRRKFLKLGVLAGGALQFQVLESMHLQMTKEKVKR
jgi:hypothetical protein